MRQDKWEQDGQTRSKTLITANTVQLLGSGSGGSSGPGGQGGQPFDRGAARPAGGAPAARPGSGQGPGNPSGDDFTDDIPF